MKKTRFILALTLAMLFAFSTLGGSIAISNNELTKNPRYVHVIKNPTQAVDCSQVVIANPDDKSVSLDLSGLVETADAAAQGEKAARGETYAVPFHPGEIDLSQCTELEPVAVKAAPVVGTTRTFNIYVAKAGDGSTMPIEFEVLAVGDNCYVWAPASASTAHRITAAHANEIRDEFDASYGKMTNAFGTISFPNGSNGKLNLMVYDIDDGYTGSGGFTAGFFWMGDMLNIEHMGARMNNEAMLHMDSYPLLYDTSGSFNGLDEAFTVAIHELQHLINYSRCNRIMTVWLNEAMSMAAEEYIYPRSAVPFRIKDWISDGDDFQNGKSLYKWDGSLGNYGLCCLFGQYLRVQTGGYEVFGRILDSYDRSASVTVQEAIIDAVEGTVFENMSMDEINASFRIALNYRSGMGIYGFHDESLFAGLTAQAITATSLSIKDGGAVTIFPLNGVFDPAHYSMYDELDFYCIVISTEPLPEGNGTMGNYAGMPQEDALDALNDALFKPIVSYKYVEVSEAENGKIISHEPKSGESVSLQRPFVTLTVGLSADNLVSMPNVIGLTSSAAQSLIRTTMAKTVITVISVRSVFPEGTVVLQTPSANSTLPQSGAYISLYVSSGKAPMTDYEIGDVTGDERINTGDAVHLLRYCAGMVMFSDLQLELGDMTGDGRVNTGDAVAILKHVAAN